MAGVLGLKLLGFALIEGFANEFPVKLLRMGLPISEFLKLGFGLHAIGEDDDLFGGTAMMGLLCKEITKEIIENQIPVEQRMVSFVQEID